MGIVILLIILAYFFPILLMPLALFAGLFLLFLPIKFTVDSLFNLFSVPGQIYQIATNPDLRKNHALEHATVNVLEQEYGYTNLKKYATNEGFYIMGSNNTIEIKSAARRGLALMKNGKSNLAIHNHCGTSIIVANFISAIIFLLLLFYSGHFSIFYMIIAILLSHLLGPYFGKIVQQYFTTTPEVDEMEIVDTRFDTDNNVWKQPSKVFVKTTKIPYIDSK